MRIHLELLNKWEIMRECLYLLILVLFLIPELDCLKPFEGFRFISLFNYIYKIISKVIVVWLNIVLKSNLS